MKPYGVNVNGGQGFPSQRQVRKWSRNSKGHGCLCELCVGVDPIYLKRKERQKKKRLLHKLLKNNNLDI